MAEEEKKKKRPEGILVVKGNEDSVERALRDGGIDTNFFIESHGNDKDMVAEALKATLLRDLKAEPGVTLKVVKFHPVVEKEKLYSGFVECRFVARDPQVLLYLTLRYGPSAIEILSPDKIVITRAELQNMAADASASVQVLVGRIMELMSPADRAKALKEGLDLSPKG
ncbi:MAG: hypothetical protein QXD77_02405 [Candidatus Aenigmatarchaeota archaeon]